MAYQLPQEVHEPLKRVCKKYNVSILKLFGSAVGETFSAGRSDLDFLVEFGSPPLGMRLSQQFFGFHEELESLLGSKVDLLEEHAIENPVLRKSALATALTLYAA